MQNRRLHGFAAAQGILSLLAGEGVGENLGDEAQLRHNLVRPWPLLGGAECQRTERALTGDDRQHKHCLVTKALHRLQVDAGLGWEIAWRRHDHRLRFLQQAQRPGEITHHLRRRLPLEGRDASIRAAPAATARCRPAHIAEALDVDERADMSEPFVEPCVHMVAGTLTNAPERRVRSSSNTRRSARARCV